jgi:penicillin-binding protein 1C
VDLRRYGLYLMFLWGGSLLLWIGCLDTKAPLTPGPLALWVVDDDGVLMGARVAEDDQWRLDSLPEVPPKLVQAIETFEDRRFRFHPGIDPLAVVRSLGQNLAGGKVVRGASTLTMQLSRLAYGNQPRTVWQKIKEAVLALKLEWQFSKDDLLRFYVDRAPYGGNVVGWHAASRRLLGRSPEQLTWAEAALLAVLPNQPGTLHLEGDRRALRAKRDRLLNTLHHRGRLDALEYQLALAEPLPVPEKQLPERAFFFTEWLRQQGTRGVKSTRLRGSWQRRAEELTLRYLEGLRALGIHHACVLVLDHDSGHPLVYVGNVPGKGEALDGSMIDMIQRPRSTGSLLKPFLFAQALAEGRLLPTSVLVDIPTRFGSYVPENFDYTYQGLVPADRALAESRNVPAVRLLAQVGVSSFLRRLQVLGITDLNQGASHYGHSLILGGGEARLFQLAHAYRWLARVLEDEAALKSKGHGWLGPQEAFLTLEALKKAKKPPFWRAVPFSDVPAALAWKTGTSFGFRDAWAIGVTKTATIAVWVGNASGAGRPGLTGAGVAVPLLFDLVQSLSLASGWWSPPDSLQKVEVCLQSGFLPGEACEERQWVWGTDQHLQVGRCPFHQRWLTDAEGQWRRLRSCGDSSDVWRHYWVLPEHLAYYTKEHLARTSLPPWDPQCEGVGDDAVELSLIYPHSGTVLVRVELPGQDHFPIVAQASHRRPGATLFWHLNGQYLGKTQREHSWLLRPSPGSHTLMVTDEWGNETFRAFDVAVVEANDPF